MTRCWINITNMSHSMITKRTWRRSWDIPWQGFKDHEYSSSRHRQLASICSKPSTLSGEVEQQATQNDMQMHVVKSLTLLTSQLWTYGQRLWGSQDGRTGSRFQVLRVFQETSSWKTCCRMVCLLNLWISVCSRYTLTRTGCDRIAPFLSRLQDHV